jgi:N-acetylglucosaminyl-diphospho-decaprenol L-rhamnosyltransferase
LRAQSLEHAVVVVDNGAMESTRRLLEERFPAVLHVRLPRNLGFGRAVNAGVAATPARTLVVLNDDVVCERGFLEELCSALDPDAGTVMAAGVLLQRRDPQRIDSAGVLFDRGLFAVDYLHGEPVELLDRPVPDPFGPTGAAAAYDRRAFDGVGGFDERFFAYLEDVDLAARLMAEGGRCRLAPRARCVHEHSATLGARSGRKNQLMGWSRGYTIGKYRLHEQPAAFAKAAAMELVIAGGQLVSDRTTSGIPSRWQGFRTGLRSPRQPLPPFPSRPKLGTVQALRIRLRRRRGSVLP